MPITRSTGGRIAVALIWLFVATVPMILVGCEGAEAAAAPRTVEFIVEGMHCDGCAESIVHSVTDVKGVTTCQVDHEGGRASIEVTSNDPQIEARLAEAISKLGFVVRYSDPDSTATDPATAPE